MYRRDLLTTLVSLHKLTYAVHKITVLSQIKVRSLRSLASKRVPNPGIERRLTALDYNDKDCLSHEELYELENSESDFMNVHLTQHEQEREMQKIQNKVRTKILEKKYFNKEVEPAMLTWEEREQIYQLHKLNPDKWNVHTLSESFPASQSAIEKILRAKWRPASVNRINQYNKSVERNWKLLSEGKLNISEETRAHLSRFSSRERQIFPPTTSYSREITKSIISPKCKEFYRIVQAAKSEDLITDPFQKLRQSFAQNSFQNPPEETYVLDNGEKKLQTVNTLDMYREMVLKSGKPLNSEDKAMMDSYKISLEKRNEPKKSISSNDFSDGAFDKYPVASLKPQNKIYVHIQIPHHLKKKGILYKLDDCYYDEDGELLYRVPGML
ncbi:Uncharacterized protein GBIM_20824 [Gryllus bimaculatus]|nr:Uncharacterized protein GBIM_20824 [Gryllus bimaculatus]